MQSTFQPYFRESEPLPARLPTINEIRSATNVICGSEEWASRRVVTVGTHFIVKHGTTVEPIEGRNLLFVEENLPQILVPKLYAMWQDTASAEFVLVIERLEGENLSVLWPDLNHTDKGAVLHKIKEVFKAARSLPSPGYLGSVSEGPLPHPLFWSSENSMMKTFETAAEMVMFLARKSRINHENLNKHSFLADFFEKQFAPLLDRTQSTFSHSDLQRKNVLVKKHQSTGDFTDFQVAVIDWEYAGWYPAYWEYVSAFFAFQWDDDWSIKIEECIDTWPAVASMMNLIYRDLWL